MEIYLNTHKLHRDMTLSLSDLRAAVEDFRDSLEPVKSKKTRRKRKSLAVDDEEDNGEGSSTAPQPPTQSTQAIDEEDAFEDPDAPLTPLAFLKSLGTSIDQFSVDANSVVFAMSKDDPFDHINRMHKIFPNRIVATCGVGWNRESQHRGRDYMMISLATVLESIFVPSYRKALINSCSGVPRMRKDIQDYLLTVAKPTHVNRPSDPVPLLRNKQTQLSNKPGTKKQWFFADEIKVHKYPEKLGTLVDHGDYKKIASALVECHDPSTSKKTDAISRVVDTMVRCPHLNCDEEGIADGTMESVAYYLIQAFHKVRFFLPHFHSNFHLLPSTMRSTPIVPSTLARSPTSHPTSPSSSTSARLALLTRRAVTCPSFTLPRSTFQSSH